MVAVSARISRSESVDLNKNLSGAVSPSATGKCLGAASLSITPVLEYCIAFRAPVNTRECAVLCASTGILRYPECYGQYWDCNTDLRVPRNLRETPAKFPANESPQ